MRESLAPISRINATPDTRMRSHYGHSTEFGPGKGSKDFQDLKSIFALLVKGTSSVRAIGATADLERQLHEFDPRQQRETDDWRCFGAIELWT